MRLSTLVPVLSLWAASVLASDVLDLDATNFKSVVDPEDLILVEFFAPWCGHCKALAPHYEKAATTLKDKNIPIAKVDCVEQAELCQEHGVQGYPTLKVYTMSCVFRNGTPSDYTGPRQEEGIVSYMVKQSLPAVTTVTATNHDEFKQADKLVAVLYVSETSDAPAAVFSSTANKHRDDYLFGISSDSEAIAAAGVTPPAIVLYRKFDEPKLEFANHVPSATVEEIETFIQENSIPLVDEVSTDNYQSYATSGLPLAYLFIDPKDETHADHVAYLKPLAKQYKGKINFVTIDATRFGDHAKALNVLEDKFPAFVIQDLKKQLKYPLDQSQDVSESTVAPWVHKFAAGEIQPKLKSQAVPEVQDEPVFVLVGSQFDEVVFDEEKDVLVEFYAPWCGHCKRLKPTWDALGEKFADIKDRIVIAKMDATENDLSPDAPFRVSGFPTIKFKPAGGRDFVDYDGDRSLESLIEFVEKNAKNPLDASTPFKGKTSSKVAAPEATAHDEL
ncbi:hypothetical protein M422DRAFT_40397 [Sphaerobolus stellatus SS14]|nr:hypothetical protein M422DRAFT_40397 [Sphaerobolus stellatus SS14]